MLRELNPLLHSELRLGVMSILISVESADFTYIRRETNATAGNLSVQLDKLTRAGYITTEKSFNGRMPRTTCRITSAGIDAFREYVDVLQSYIANLPAPR
ncbi:MAG: transcriptional regulator [Tannerella sp.]|jgi:DNA-binding MarR family transcriptional regulator|nr:transcriptional regulator [Tannerella sp.]